MSRHIESRADRRARGRALANFFGAGALLSTLVLLLPGWEDLHTAGIAATVVAAGSVATALHLGAAGAGRVTIHTLTTAGTALIAACQVLAGGGSPTTAYALLYVWVVLHCALFFERAVIVAHLAATTVAQVAALWWVGDVASMAPQVTLTLGTQIAAAVVVGSLATRQRTMADTDALTGLGNRRTAERALEWAIDRARRSSDAATCVAVLDLDGFKAYNDRLGHVAGDDLLSATARTWRELARPTDVLARTGGDEFLLVLADCDLDQAERVVRRMLGATPDGVACSAGLARWHPDETAAALVGRADAALYRAKDSDDGVSVADVPAGVG